MSYAMDERQKARTNGKYIEMAKCEVCHKPVGMSYYSAQSSNSTGKGLILCHKCCKIWDATAQNCDLG